MDLIENKLYILYNKNERPLLLKYLRKENKGPFLNIDNIYSFFLISSLEKRYPKRYSTRLTGDKYNKIYLWESEIKDLILI